MPVTRRRAAVAAAAAVVEEGVGAAAVYISSDSDAGSESGSSEEDEEESTSVEDYVDVNDSGDEYIDIISDSDADDEEGNRAGKEEEAKVEQSGVDRSEAACSKIADLLRHGAGFRSPLLGSGTTRIDYIQERLSLRGRDLEGIKLVECKAYLKQNGLSQTGDIATCVERTMLHWREKNIRNQTLKTSRPANLFKNGDPEKIYPRSSFCINCKGDVCRGDTVLFKQKVYEKSGKRHSNFIGKRIVAGKVIKESYGKEKQQHTFTIQVFWSKGVGSLQPLYLLLVKGRNLYRMMTFRQPWPNEAQRLKLLEEKHSRGDAARRVRALSRHNSAGHALKGNKSMEKGKHQSQLQRPVGGSKTTKGKKRVMQSFISDPPTKKSRKQEHLVSSGKKRTGGRRATTNCAALEKNICSSSNSSICNDNSVTDLVTLQRNSQVAPVNNGLYSRQVRMSKRKASSKQKNNVGGNNAHFEGRHVTSASHVHAYRGNLVGIQQPSFERPQQPPPLREVGNALQLGTDGRSIACPNPMMAFQHPNAALAGWRAPYFRGPPPNQPGVVFPPLNMSQTINRPHPEGVYVMPEFRYSGGSNDFPR